MERAIRSARTAAWLDAVAGTAFAALVPLSYYQAHLAAAEAVRLYGHNVDSGAYLIAIAVFYFAPAAIFLGLASTTLFLHWRFGKFLHRLSWSWVALPFALSFLSWLRMAVVA